MKRIELIHRIIARKEELGITIENLARLSGVGVRTINRLLKNEDIKLSTVERVTNVLGLDFAGRAHIPLKELREQRAKAKAIFLASLVQGTSTLENQGLDEENLHTIITMYENELLHGRYQDTLWVA